MSQTLHVSLRRIGEREVEVRYFTERPDVFDARRLSMEQVASMVEDAQKGYYDRARPDLITVGVALYCWLDTPERRLETELKRLTTGDGPLVLSVEAEPPLVHLPWETLHDGRTFLVQRTPPVVVMRRRMRGGAARAWSPDARALRVLFMASAPDDLPPLDFEMEERLIAESAARVGIELLIEESGELSKMRCAVADDPEPFDVVHLSGHAGHSSDGTPGFFTEGESGETRFATAGNIAQALGPRWPKLLFLSGCRTGESPNGGASPSLAERLIDSGAKSVLSWGKSVFDGEANRAAAALYHALAEGATIASALAETRATLIRDAQKNGNLGAPRDVAFGSEADAGFIGAATDWHLLRLFVAGEPPPPLVAPRRTPGWKPARPRTFANVPGRRNLRRLIRRCIKTLREDDGVGLVVYGAEAAENRLIASHLCDRLAEYGAPMRIASPLDEASVIADLRDALYMERSVRAILDENDDVAYRLRRVLSSLERPALILLDDFGRNYEAYADGSPPMRPESRATLRLLVDAVRRSASGHRHRLVICSPFPLEGETGALLRQERVTVAPQNDAPRADLIRAAYGLADGNPHLRGRLTRLLDAQVDCERIFAHLRSALPERAESVLNAELAKMESHHVRRLLATGLLLRATVPRAAFETVCSEIPNLSRTIARALDLELINVTADGEILCQAHGLADAVADAMPPNVPVLCRRAAEALRAAWWEECERPTPEMVSEIKRLVGIAEKGLGDFGFRLEARSAWQARLLYDWAVAAIAREEIIPALNCLQDEVFPAYGRLGDLHAQAVTAGRMADIRLRQGDWREALRIRREDELPVYERFNDAYAIAITKSQIADILCHFSGERSPDADNDSFFGKGR